MKWMRWTAAVLVGMLLATGLVRAAGTQFGALRGKARKALEVSSAKNGVQTDDDDSTATPAIVLASPAEIAPAGQARVSATGNWGAKTAFAVSGAGFSLTDVAVGKGSFSGTIAAAAGILPSAAVLRATNRHGTGEARAAFVAGTWQIEGTTDNGWRVRMAPVPPKKPGTLAFKADFYEGAAKTPFTSRDARIVLQPLEAQTATYTVTIEAPNVLGDLSDAECDPIMARAGELAGKLMNAKTQAEEDRISAQVDEIQDKIDMCIERQQENSEKVSARMKAADEQRRLDAKKFGCRSLSLTVAPGGAAEGQFTCAAGTPNFKGTMSIAR